MKKYTLLLLITLLLVSSCERKNSNYKYDKSKVVLLPSKKNTFIPTDEELTLADDIVLKRMGIYNAEQEAFNIDRNYMFGDTIHYTSDKIIWKNYYKQIIAFKNEKGEKIIHFNCLCGIDKRMVPNWKNEYLRVHDGGSCFFKISVNLTRNVVFGFEVNGVA